MAQPVNRKAIENELTNSAQALQKFVSAVVFVPAAIDQILCH